MALFTLPIARVADSNFRVGAGYKLYFYAAGTSTAKDTYTSNTYATPNSNPVVADSSGYFSQIWTNGDYKVVLTTDEDVVVWTVDNYNNDANTSKFAEGVLSAAGSAADVITANLPTSPGTLEDQQQVVVELQHGANTTSTPTFNLNSLGAKTIVKFNNQALAVGDTGGSGAKLYLSYSETNDKWVLLNPQGSKINKYIYTSSDTYTPAVGTTRIDFEAVGGGGGGGGVDGQGAGTAAASGGGGGGGYCFKTTTTIEASYTITIGSGGSGGAAGANNGSAGGDTTVVGSVPTLSMTAGGGSAGLGVTAGSASTVVGVGGAGGTASGGDINSRGGYGFWGRISALGGTYFAMTLGFGGASAFRPSPYGVNGTYGAGGSGAAVEEAATNTAGKDGGDGIVIVTEYVGFIS